MTRSEPFALTRERIVDTAMGLFYRRGYHAIGVDDVAVSLGADRAGIERWFDSKDALVLATLERREALFLDWLDRRIGERAEAPAARLLALFDVLEEWYAGPGFHGCMFINASVEFCNADDPVRRAAATHKRALHAYVRRMAEAAVPADRAGALAQQLILLMEGAIVTTQVSGAPVIAAEVRGAAKVLIEHATAAA